MSFKLKTFFSIVAVIVTLLAASCSSDDDDPNEPDADLGNARLTDFPLTEVEYLNINIIHPELANGEETKQGKIEITIPYSRQSMELSLKEFKLDNSKYTISPGIGEVQVFTTEGVIYTITSNIDPDKAVHYLVTIVHGGDPFTENNEITGFKFEASKNPALASTIDALKIVRYENSSDGAIYVIVPAGTDFSNLTPTITFDAAELKYRTDGIFETYPPGGMAVNFKYPKRFSIQAENSLGVKSQIYHVIVDVKDPIRFEKATLVTPQVKIDDGTTFEFFSAIMTWTNQGNHPVTGMSPDNYKDKVYPIPDYTGNANFITATITNPVGGTPGVLPGETGHVNVNVRRIPQTGLFSTTAVFNPTFSFDSQTISSWPIDDRTEDLFEPPSFIINSTLEE
jgi:hypothetical protein